MMDYTGRLARRMQAVGWKPGDSMYVYALRAHDALHALRAVCGLSEAGRPSEPPKG